MIDKGRDQTIAALEAVYAALKDLDPSNRKKVLSSAFALLGVESASISTLSPASPQVSQQAPSQIASPSRPVSLVELIRDKEPGTNAQKIAVFAYYREKIENLPRFSRLDLQPYFAKARVTPAANFDRDFGVAVKNAWIHEDGSESYLTTKGVEAVENGFDNAPRNPARKRRDLRKKRL